MKEILQNAVVQMVRIGNKVNWNSPIDQDYVNALNGLRELLAATQQSVRPTNDGLGECFCNFGLTGYHAEWCPTKPVISG